VFLTGYQSHLLYDVMKRRMIRTVIDIHVILICSLVDVIGSINQLVIVGRKELCNDANFPGTDNDNPMKNIYYD
jgi:hypothetical protein